MDSSRILPTVLTLTFFRTFPPNWARIQMHLKMVRSTGQELAFCKRKKLVRACTTPLTASITLKSKRLPTPPRASPGEEEGELAEACLQAGRDGVDEEWGRGRLQALLRSVPVPVFPRDYSTCQ